MQFIFLSPNVKIWFVLLFLEGKFVCKIPKLKRNLERLWVITADEKQKQMAALKCLMKSIHNRTYV